MYIMKFSYILCRVLENKSKNKFATRFLAHNPVITKEDMLATLEIETGSDSHRTRPPSLKNIKCSRSIGTAMNLYCCTCKKQLRMINMINYFQPYFHCSICKINLLKETHYNPSVGRYFVYVGEHTHAEEEHIQCAYRYAI